MKIRDRILTLLPMGEHLVHSLVDGTAAEIEDTIKRLQHAGLIGRRVCSTTGGALLVDRRSSRTDEPVQSAAPVIERKVKRASFRHQPKRTPAEKHITAMLRRGA